jgi:hypothetical protein
MKQTECSETSAYKIQTQGKLARRKHTTFRTWRKFEIKNKVQLITNIKLLHVSALAVPFPLTLTCIYSYLGASRPISGILLDHTAALALWSFSFVFFVVDSSFCFKTFENFVLLIQSVLLQSVHPQTDALNKMQFMTSTNLLAPEIYI